MGWLDGAPVTNAAINTPLNNSKLGLGVLSMIE
jgi:hypothetical protein